MGKKEKQWSLQRFNRDDPWWHNAYKIRLNKAYPSESYELEATRNIQMKTDGNIIMKMGCMYKTIGFRIMEIGSFLIQTATC